MKMFDRMNQLSVVGLLVSALTAEAHAVSSPVTYDFKACVETALSQTLKWM